MITIAARMQNLHTDLTASLMHRLRDHAMLTDLPRKTQLTGVGRKAAAKIRGNTTRHNQTHTAQSAFFVERCQFLKSALFFFQTCVH